MNNNGTQKMIGILLFFGIAYIILSSKISKGKNSPSVTTRRKLDTAVPVSRQVVEPSSIVDGKNFGYIETIINGYNYSNVFVAFDVFSNEYQNLFNGLNPQVLRFTGGTIANYAHEKGVGYGFIQSELDTATEGVMGQNIKNLGAKYQSATVNYHDTFSSFAKKNSFGVIYTVNVLTGTVDEALSIIKKLKSNGIDIVAFELGNELYLKAYSNKVKSVSDYIALCKPFALALKSKYPDTPILAIANLNEKTTANSWNSLLALNDWYDAYTVHSYPDKNETGFSFEKALNGLQSYLSNTYVRKIQHLSKLFNRPVWVTEYNIFDPYSYGGGTMLQALYVCDFIMTNLAIEQQAPNTVDALILHTLSSPDKGYSVMYDGNPITVTPMYDVMSMFKLLVTNSDWKYEIQQKGVVKQLYAYSLNAKKMVQIVLNQSSASLNYQLPAFSLENVKKTLTPIKGQSVYGELYSGNKRSKSNENISKLNVNQQNREYNVVGLDANKTSLIYPYSVTQFTFELS